MRLSPKSAKLLNSHMVEPFGGRVRSKFLPLAEVKVLEGCECEAFSRHPKGFLMSLGAFSYVAAATRDTMKMKVGRYCSIARGVNVVGGNHPIDAVTTSSFFYGIYHSEHLPEFVNQAENPGFLRDLGDVQVGHDVWIGGYCVIKGGIRIGTGAVIAAGSVVVKDVAPYTIVGGNPAKVIRPRFDELTIKMLLDSEWWTIDPKTFRDLKMFDLQAFCDGLNQMRMDGTAKPFNPPKLALLGTEIVEAVSPA